MLPALHTCNLLKKNLYTKCDLRDILRVNSWMEPNYPPVYFSNDYSSSINSMYSNINIVTSTHLVNYPDGFDRCPMTTQRQVYLMVLNKISPKETTHKSNGKEVKQTHYDDISVELIWKIHLLLNNELAWLLH